MRPLKWKLLSSPFLWCCLCFFFFSSFLLNISFSFDFGQPWQWKTWSSTRSEHSTSVHRLCRASISLNRIKHGWQLRVGFDLRQEFTQQRAFIWKGSIKIGINSSSKERVIIKTTISKLLIIAREWLSSDDLEVENWSFKASTVTPPLTPNRIPLR